MDTQRPHITFDLDHRAQRVYVTPHLVIMHMCIVLLKYFEQIRSYGSDKRKLTDEQTIICAPFDRRLKSGFTL